nr:hypothetical protein [Tanacetum cinerariifolium]
MHQDSIQKNTCIWFIAKGFPGVDTPLFDTMLVQQQVQDVAEVNEEDEDDNEVSAAPTPPSPTLMETCATLTQKVANLEQDKIAQALEITKLKQRVKKLEKKGGFKSSCLKMLRRVGTAQRVESSNDTVDIDEAGHAKVKEVLEVVTSAKLMTEVVTTAAPITIAAQVPKASTPSRRRGVVIQDPKETTRASRSADVGLVYGKDQGKHIDVDGFVDVDYAKDPDKGRSIIGEIVESKKIKVKKIGMKDNAADAFTKNPTYAKPKEEFEIRVLMASLASMFEDPDNEEKDVFLEYIIWPGVTASVKKRFLVVVVLGGLFEIRDHIVDTVVSARILEVSLVFLVLNGGK